MKITDKKIMADILKENTFYTIVYFVLIISAGIYSDFFSLNSLEIVKYLAMLFALVFFVKQHLLLKSKEKSESACTDNSGFSEAPEYMPLPEESIKPAIIFNSFSISLFIQIFIPFLVGILIYLYILKNILNRYIINESLILYIYSALFILVFTALILFLWSNFKSLFRTVFFAVFFTATSIFTFFMINIYLKKYLIGFYSFISVYINNVLSQIINSNRESVNVTIIFAAIITAAILFILGQRTYNKDNLKKPKIIVTYLALLIPNITFAFIIFLPGESKIIPALIVFFIFAFVICIIVELLLYIKMFKFKQFLMRFFIVFTVLSMALMALRYDLIGFVNRIPSTETVSQVELSITDLDNSDYKDYPMLSGPLKEYIFKSPEAINAIAQLHKGLIPFEKNFSVAYKNNKNLLEENTYFGVTIKYKLKPAGSLERQYDTIYNYRDDPSLILPVIQTEEFKQQYFDVLYKDASEKVIIISALEEDTDFNNKNGLIKKEMKSQAADIINAMITDVNSNNFDFIVEKDVSYKYTVQVVLLDDKGNISPSTVGYYYIPSFYKNTISYIENNKDILFTAEINK